MCLIVFAKDAHPRYKFVLAANRDEFYARPTAPSGVKSRGDLNKDFLTSDDSAENYLREIEKSKNNYLGFNLLVGNFAENKNELFYVSNRGEKIEKNDERNFRLEQRIA